MVSNKVAYITMALVIAACGALGWYGRGWYDDSKELSRLNYAMVVAIQLQSDLNGATAALQKERADMLAVYNKLDKDIANYVKNPDRVTTKFDADRVRIKAEAARAANSVSGPSR